MNAPPARILALEPDDAERIAQLAAEIWRHHYPGIISAAQIEYMLKQRYEPALIRRELRERGLWWDKLVSGEAIIGFASCFLTDETNDMKLDKLYVHRDWQRRGLGGRLIAQVCEHARSSGCRRVILAVNRHNAGAIAAYLKYGFAIRGTRVADIGGGFVMDDYLMAREL
jgi:ribosomal protein S18 acetylase RimI-like enzyme